MLNSFKFTRQPTYSPQAELMLAQMDSFDRAKFEQWFFNESAHTVIGGGHILDYFMQLANKKNQ